MTGTWLEPTAVAKSAGTQDGTSKSPRTAGVRTWRWPGPVEVGRCLAWFRGGAAYR
jgi:hypothetical protein